MTINTIKHFNKLFHNKIIIIKIIKQLKSQAPSFQYDIWLGYVYYTFVSIYLRQKLSQLDQFNWIDWVWWHLCPVLATIVSNYYQGRKFNCIKCLFNSQSLPATQSNKNISQVKHLLGYIVEKISRITLFCPWHIHVSLCCEVILRGLLPLPPCSSPHSSNTLEAYSCHALLHNRSVT